MPLIELRLPQDYAHAMVNWRQGSVGGRGQYRAGLDNVTGPPFAERARQVNPVWHRPRLPQSGKCLWATVLATDEFRPFGVTPPRPFVEHVGAYQAVGGRARRLKIRGFRPHHLGSRVDAVITDAELAAPLRVSVQRSIDIRRASGHARTDVTS